MNSSPSLAQKISLLITLKGRKQSELARQLGVQPSNLNHYLRGHSDVHAKQFVAILRELGLDIEDQINREIAGLNKMKIVERKSVGEAVESVVRALPPTERRAMLGYVMKLAQLALGSRVKEQLQPLREML